MTYREQLRDPRWRRYCVRICAERGDVCQECREPVPLEVHHVTYLRGVLLWEYPDELVLCLCRPCHLNRQVNDEEARMEFSRMCARMSSDAVYSLSKKLRSDLDNGWAPKLWDAYQSLKEATNVG